MPLIKLFLEICLFRKGPQDAPASIFLLGLSSAAYFAVGFVLLGLKIQWLEAVLQVFLEAVMLLGFVWVSLMVAGKLTRMLQTTIAMMGTDALISSFAVPLLAFLMENPQASIIQLFLLLLMFWHVAVVAHILRHALSQPFGMGLGLAVIYVVLSYQVMVMLFPQG
ncbi:MAG: hypothetical protein PHE55_02870 [Methylococcaceae bacterium]|nr:hypothetical protein [Methylococcaceae bacterium]